MKKYVSCKRYIFHRNERNTVGILTEIGELTYQT